MNLGGHFFGLIRGANSLKIPIPHSANPRVGSVKNLQQLLSGADKNGSNKLDPMLVYFLGTLDVRLRRVSPAIVPGSDPAREGILEEIKRASADFPVTYATFGKEEAAWNEANRLERLFALVEPTENLWAELKRRLAEAADEKVGSTARLVASADALAPIVVDPKAPGNLLPGADVIVRSLLLETLEETHWTVQRKFYSRPIRKSATTRIVCFGMAAFLLFLLPHLLLYYSVWHEKSDPIASWAWLPIYTAATAGLFGALFSRLLYLQSKWDTLTIGGLKDAREFTSIILRGCVGMIGAVIVFFFLKSGVIGGSLFPTFSDIGIEKFPSSEKKTTGNLVTALNLYYPTKDLALLVVWSFLAGFSERLVPSILRDTETTLGKAPQK